MPTIKITKKCPQCGKMSTVYFPHTEPWAEDFKDCGICRECWEQNEYWGEDLVPEEDD